MHIMWRANKARKINCLKTNKNMNVFSYKVHVTITHTKRWIFFPSINIAKLIQQTNHHSFFLSNLLYNFHVSYIQVKNKHKFLFCNPLHFQPSIIIENEAHLILLHHPLIHIILEYHRIHTSRYSALSFIYNEME